MNDAAANEVLEGAGVLLLLSRLRLAAIRCRLRLRLRLLVLGVVKLVANLERLLDSLHVIANLGQLLGLVLGKLALVDLGVGENLLGLINLVVLQLHEVLVAQGAGVENLLHC